MTTVTPVGIQRSRAAGSKMVSPNGLPIQYVGRHGIFGNPFGVEDAITLGFAKTREAALAWCVEQFELLMEKGSDATAWGHTDELDSQRRLILFSLPWLAGKNLSCWCPLTGPCHRNTLLRLANPRVTFYPCGCRKAADGEMVQCERHVNEPLRAALT